MSYSLTPILISFLSDQGVPEPSIEWRFPPKELPKPDLQVVAMINEFCFPDSTTFPKVKISNKNKKFTFVVTSVDGIKRFGYCKRHLVGEINLTNKGKRFAMCYCILSLSPNHAIFDAILEAAEGMSRDSLMVMLYKLQKSKIPPPGGKLEIVIPALDQPERTFRFTRSLNNDQTLSGFASYDALLTHLDPFSIVSILIAMLCERRIIFVSSKLSTLSSCVQASVALIYPFVWQHVFIPVLPVRMIPFVCAPVPFVVGLLSLHLDKLYEQADGMEEVIIVDLDHGNIVPPPSDYKLLSEKYLKPLVYAFQTAKQLAESPKKFTLRTILNRTISKNLQHQAVDGEEIETVQNILERGFASFLGKTVGHFHSFVRKEGFDQKEFIKHIPELTEFLTAIAGSQLFEMFVNDRNNDQLAELYQGEEDTDPTEKSKRLSQYDPSTTDVYLREGYLEKYGKGFRGNIVSDVGTFQTRYFRLTTNALSYYRNNRPDAEPSGIIDLIDLDVVQLIEFQGHSECLELKTCDRSYYMYSNDSANIQMWYAILSWRVKDLLGDRKPNFQPSIVDEEFSKNTFSSQRLEKTDGPVIKQRVRSGNCSSVPVIRPKFVNRNTIEFVPLFKVPSEGNTKTTPPKEESLSSELSSMKMRKHSRLSRSTPKPFTLSLESDHDEAPPVESPKSPTESKPQWERAHKPGTIENKHSFLTTRESTLSVNRQNNTLPRGPNE